MNRKRLAFVLLQVTLLLMASLTSVKQMASAEMGDILYSPASPTSEFEQREIEVNDGNEDSENTDPTVLWTIGLSLLVSFLAVSPLLEDSTASNSEAAKPTSPAPLAPRSNATQQEKHDHYLKLYVAYLVISLFAGLITPNVFSLPINDAVAFNLFGVFLGSWTIYQLLRLFSGGQWIYTLTGLWAGATAVAVLGLREGYSTALRDSWLLVLQITSLTLSTISAISFSYAVVFGLKGVNSIRIFGEKREIELTTSVVFLIATIIQLTTVVLFIVLELLRLD